MQSELQSLDTATNFIKIAIASNKNFYKTTVPILIDSLIAAGIEKNEIFVFISGCETANHEKVDGITFFYLNHHSFELSPLIEIVERGLNHKYWTRQNM